MGGFAEVDVGKLALEPLRALWPSVRLLATFSLPRAPQAGLARPFFQLSVDIRRSALPSHPIISGSNPVSAGEEQPAHAQNGTVYESGQGQTFADRLCGKADHADSGFRNSVTLPARTGRSQ